MMDPAVRPAARLGRIAVVLSAASCCLRASGTAISLAGLQTFAAAVAAAPPAEAPLAWQLWPLDVGAFIVEPAVSTTLRWNVTQTCAWAGGQPRSCPGASPSAGQVFNYSVRGYSGCLPKCVRGGPNFTCLAWDSCSFPRSLVPSAAGSVACHRAAGTPAAQQLTLTLTLPTAGFFEINFTLPSGAHSTFGLVSQPAFAKRHPEGRDPAFSVCAFLSLASAGPSWSWNAGGYLQPQDTAQDFSGRNLSNYRPDFAAWRQQTIGVMGSLGVASVREWGVGSDGAESHPGLQTTRDRRR